MSTHVVNLGTQDLDTIAERFIRQALAMTGLGIPTAYDLNQQTGDLTMTWEVTLSAGQATALSEIARAAKTGLTRAERNALQADIDGLITYQGIASPTLAQTASAVKAQSRILRAILRS